MLMTLCNGCTIEFSYEGFFTPLEPKSDPFKGLIDYGLMDSSGLIITGSFAPADEWCPPVTEVPPIVSPSPPVGHIPLPGTLILLVLGLVLMRRVWVWVN